MADWSTVYRWGGYPKGDWGRLLAHDVRDVDREHGTEVAHSNPNIDAARTSDNETWVPDGSGGWRRPASRAEVADRIRARLATAKQTTTRRYKDGRVVEVARRKDATEVQEFLCQLDPLFTGTSREVLSDPQRREEVDRLLSVMAERVVAVMGPENVHAVCVHWDETSPHLQIITTPVTADGEINFKRFIGGGHRGWAAEHDEMRSALREAGYDATFERVDGGRGHDGATNFGRNRDRAAELDAREADINTVARATAREAEKVDQTREEASSDREKAAEALQAAQEAQQAAEARLAALQAAPDLWREYLHAHPQVRASYDQYVEQRWAEQVRRNTDELGRYTGPSRQGWEQRDRSGMSVQRRATVRQQEMETEAPQGRHRPGGLGTS